MDIFFKSYIRDAKDMSILLYEPSLHKKAQEASSGVIGVLKEEMGRVYDPNNPIESVLEIVGPGLLWMLGFRWITVIYEIAAALGFDWHGFFVSIKNFIKPLLTDISAGKTADNMNLDSAVKNSVVENFSKPIDSQGLIQAVEKSSGINDMLRLKKFAKRWGEPNLLSSIISFFNNNDTAKQRMRGSSGGFISRFMSWLLKLFLISFGLLIAQRGVSHLFGTDKSNENNNSTTNNWDSKEDIGDNGKTVALALNTQADPSLFTLSFNDKDHVWVINYSLSDIKNKLIEWAQELYPQLTDNQAFEISSAFKNTLSMFRDRNKNSNVHMIAVPQPFRSIKEIVLSFAADVAAHTKEKQ